MFDLFYAELALPILIGIALSFLIERWLQPKPLPLWRRHWTSFMTHVGLWLLLFAIDFLISRRPWYSMSIVLAFQLLVVQISNAKIHSLREPFVFQDFEYITDALKHYRLYIPFLGVGRALVVILGFGVAVYAGFVLEPSLTVQVPGLKFLKMVTILTVCGGISLWLGVRKKLAVTFEPATDIQQLGLMTSLWRYGEEERGRHRVPSIYESLDPNTSDALPNLVVVQSESFFDARGLFSGIRPEVLHEFDDIKASAVLHGQVAVPAWGANTIRTEFSFLSGLNDELLGVHRFNPYRKLAGQGIPTLAHFLQQLGYRTVCVHPYHAGLYARDKVYPLLGFDELIDIASFGEDEKAGPYIGDVALANKVCHLLESADQPVFVFVISMENHGPLHLEKIRDGDVERLYKTPPPENCDDLTIYLRHLLNADRMAGMLRAKLETMPGNGWLCWYGDHVPILPKVYAAMGEPDGKTDYLIWTAGGRPEKTIKRDLSIENLGELLLQRMELARFRQH